MNTLSPTENKKGSGGFLFSTLTHISATTQPIISPWETLRRWEAKDREQMLCFKWVRLISSHGQTAFRKGSNIVYRNKEEKKMWKYELKCGMQKNKKYSK